MSATLVCASCGTVLTFHAAPVSECAKCGAVIDPAVRARLEAELAYSRARRPMLLLVGAAGSSLVGGMTLLFLLLAPFNIGEYKVSGESVTGPEFLRIAGIPFFVNTVLLAAIAYGIIAERYWARHLMLLFWCLITAVALGFVIRDRTSENGCAAVFAFLALGLAAWYLYAKATVVQYYRALEQRAASSHAV